MAKKSRHPETIVLHAGWRADPTTGAVAPPIYQTTSFQFQSAEHASNLFALKELGNIYTRLGNPTTAILEERIAALEGGAAAVARHDGDGPVLDSRGNGLAKELQNVVGESAGREVPIADGAPKEHVAHAAADDPAAKPALGEARRDAANVLGDEGKPIDHGALSESVAVERRRTGPRRRP